MHPYDRWLQIHHMVDVYPPREDDVARARRAYYGMISYFDAVVGDLVDELERLGLAQDTLVLLTADHGEMLGEHGMWFKRTYFEPSVRVPLIVAGADRVPVGERVAQTVSLVDLMPTLLEIAGLEDWEQIEGELDGDSLCGLLRGEKRPWKDYAVAEYYSEGVVSPMRMAVSRRLKYVYVHQEADQLFDLRRDPHELCNCIDRPEYADRLEQLRRLVHTGWDAEATTRQVLESQRQRRLILEALAAGPSRPWDAESDFHAHEQYVRKENAQVTSARLRYPRAGLPAKRSAD